MDSSKDLPNDWQSMFGSFDKLRKKKKRHGDDGDGDDVDSAGGTSDEVKYFFFKLQTKEYLN